MKALLGLAVAAACGPPGPSLAENAQARAWVAGGVVLACQRAHPDPVRLGRRANVHEVRLAGRYAGVHTRDLLVVHDLRRGRIEQMRRLGGTMARWIMDRAGVAAYAVRRPSGVVAIGSSVDGTVARARAIDPTSLGLAQELIAYRYGDTHHLAHAGVEADVIAARRTLIRAGSLRIETLPRAWSPSVLVARSGAMRRRLGAATGPCISPSGCTGVDALQIAGRFVATRIRASNPNYSSGSVTVRGLDGGPALRDCAGRGDVGAFVVTETGGFACGFAAADPDHPAPVVPEIRAGGAVIARASGIDIDSLRRRGDQLVWIEDGAERTAPLPS
jgi:hypothetical protein